MTIQVPFAVNGKINNLTVNLGPSQLSSGQQKKVVEAVGRATD